MTLNYRNLDARIRALMLTEIDRDIAAGTLFLSDNLSPIGRDEYPNLLQAAARDGTDGSLSMEIRGRLNSHEKPRKLQSGGFSKPPVMRVNAHEMLAEGEFNRFYIRAVCARAIEDGIKNVIVYRAKNVEHPRPESERKIGQSVDPEAVLNDLRNHPGVDTALGLPQGPNSGLSITLP